MGEFVKDIPQLNPHRFEEGIKFGGAVNLYMDDVRGRPR